MLKVENLSFSVMEEGRSRKIIDNVSFSVSEGEMLVITGPNGSGKSTMAAAYGWKGIPSPHTTSTSGQRQASAMRFSSRPVLKG